MVAALNDTLLSVMLSESVKEKLRVTAALAGLPMSAFCRRVLERAVERSQAEIRLVGALDLARGLGTWEATVVECAEEAVLEEASSDPEAFWDRIGGDQGGAA